MIVNDQYFRNKFWEVGVERGIYRRLCRRDVWCETLKKKKSSFSTEKDITYRKNKMKQRFWSTKEKEQVVSRGYKQNHKGPY